MIRGNTHAKRIDVMGTDVRQPTGTPKKAYLWAIVFAFCVSLNLFAFALGSREWHVPYYSTETPHSEELRDTALLLRMAHFLFNHESLYLWVPFIVASLIVYRAVSGHQQSSLLIGFMKHFASLYLVLVCPFLLLSHSPSQFQLTLGIGVLANAFALFWAALWLAFRHPYKFKGLASEGEGSSASDSTGGDAVAASTASMASAAARDVIEAVSDDGQTIIVPKKEEIEQER